MTVQWMARALSRVPRWGLTQITGLLLVILWPTAIIHLLFNPSWLGWGATAIFGVYLLVSLAVIGWGNRILGLTLILAILVLAAVDNSWLTLARELEAALVFAAFMPAIYLLRSVLAGDKRVLGYRDRIAAVPSAERPGWMLIGSHVLGGALAVGALAVMSPVLDAEDDTDTRRATALATVSGVALSLVWSPVFVAMAVVSDFVPGVPLWQPVLLGLGLATVGLMLALVLIGIKDKCRVVLRALAALRPVIPMVVGVAGIIILIRTHTPLSTLEAASLSLPPLSLLLLALQPVSALRSTIQDTRHGLDSMGAEVSIVALAFAMGLLLRDSHSTQALIEGLLVPGLPVVVLITMIVGGMIAAAASAIHPIVAGSILLAIFTSAETGLSDLVIAGAVLVGWACGAMLAVAGMLVMVATTMLRLTRYEMILGRNALVVLLFAFIGIVLLTAMNSILTP